MNEANIDDIDTSLEIASLVRTSEAAIARDYRVGSAFGHEADKRRLNAFTLGLLDALAQRIGDLRPTLELFTYMHVAMEHGPGKNARKAFREYIELASDPRLARYIAAGRRHILRVLIGNGTRPGRFAELLSEELLEGS